MSTVSTMSTANTDAIEPGYSDEELAAVGRGVLQETYETFGCLLDDGNTGEARSLVERMQVLNPIFAQDLREYATVMYGIVL